MNQPEFDNLISSLDTIAENFTIGCGPGKIPIPVSDFSLDQEKVEQWITSHSQEYQQGARIFTTDIVKHISYKEFVKNCSRTVTQLYKSILNKLQSLAGGQRLLILLNLHQVDSYKSENWVFSLMYRGLETLGATSHLSNSYLRTIFFNLYQTYPDQLVIRLVYSNDYPTLIPQILNDPTDYLIMDCKFDDCSYSGSQLTGNLLIIANLWFKLLRDHPKYTTKNPKDIDENNSLIYLDQNRESSIYTSNKSNAESVKHSKNLLLALAKNFGIGLVDTIDQKKAIYDTMHRLRTNNYQGSCNIPLYTTTGNSFPNYSYREALEKFNHLFQTKIKVSVNKFNKSLQVFWDPDDPELSFCHLYRQEKSLNYYNCLCIPYISDTTIELLEKLERQNVFFSLERYNPVTPKNIKSLANSFNRDNNGMLNVYDIRKLLYGTNFQRGNLCSHYDLTFKDPGDSCGYYENIEKYQDNFQERCPIYFDHKMATFNSTVPMSLVLGIVWAPSREASEQHKTQHDIPIFIGPLIKNPNDVTFSNDELITLFKNFGSSDEFNYYFFDRFVRPPYKLKTAEEKASYVKSYNNCKTISQEHCECLPTCQLVGERCSRKT